MSPAASWRPASPAPAVAARPRRRRPQSRGVPVPARGAVRPPARRRADGCRTRPAAGPPAPRSASASPRPLRPVPRRRRRAGARPAWRAAHAGRPFPLPARRCAVPGSRAARSDRLGTARRPEVPPSPQARAPCRACQSCRRRPPPAKSAPWRSRVAGLPGLGWRATPSGLPRPPRPRPEPQRPRACGAAALSRRASPERPRSPLASSPPCQNSRDRRASASGPVT